MRFPLVLAVLAAVSGVREARAYSSFPPTDHIDINWPIQPPLRQKCTECHTGFTGPGTLSLLNLPPTWQPGQTYSLIIELVDPTAAIFGFETTVLDASFAEAGTMTRTDLAGTAMTTDPDRKVPFLFHTSGGNQCNLCPGVNGRDWGFDWTAPAAGTGDVTFYACANGGDGSGTSFGDHIYCMTAKLAEMPCTPPLGAMTGLEAVTSGADLVWSWTPDPNAAQGYRLYAVPAKDVIASANGSTPTAIRNCPSSSASDSSCTESGAAADPGPWFYQLLAVCSAGLEGPN